MIPVVFSVISKPPFGNGYVYDGFPHALECAARLSGQPVFVLTDATLPKVDGVTVLPLSQIVSSPHCYRFMQEYDRVSRLKSSDPLVRLNVPSTLRWYYLLRAITQGILPERIFFIDWDVLICSNIEEACEPFNAFDLLCADMHPGKVSQSPCGVFSVNALRTFIQWVHNQLLSKSIIPLDMGAWTDIYNTNAYRVANVGAEHKPSATCIDGNLGDLEDSEFVADETGYKKIVWQNNQPHFERKSGGLVRTHTLHCWGAYKPKLPELAKRLMQ